MSELEHLVTSDVLRQIELYNPLLIEFNINPKFCFVQVDSLVLYLDTSFLGPLSADGNDGSARGISRGELDPVTRQPFLPLESLEILPNGDLRRQISSGQTQAVSQSSTNSRQQSTSSSSVVYSSNSNSNSSYGKTSFVTTGVVFKASTHAHTHVPSYASIPSSSSSSTVPSAPPTTMFASLPSVAQSPRRSPRKRSSDSIQSYTLTARREDAVTTAETAIDISQEMEGSCTTTLRTNLQVFAPKDDRPILQSTSIRASSTSSSSRLSGGGNNNTSVSNSSKKLTQFFSTSNSKMPMPKSSSLALPVTASSVKTAQSKLPKVSGKSLISSHKASTSSATFPLSKKQKLSQSEYKKFLTLSGPDGSDGGKNTRAISSNERTSSLSISLTDSDDEVYNKRRVNSDVIDITDSPAVVSRKEKKTPRTAQSDGSGGTGSSGDQVSTGISPRPYEHSLSPPTGKDATKKLFERFGIC